MNTYHIDVFFPAQINRILPKGILPLSITRHAAVACKDDRYGAFNLPQYVDMGKAKVFEASFLDGKLHKFAARLSYNTTHDMVVVIVKDKGNYAIKTAWLNMVNDSHKTLNAGKYATCLVS